jgi:hypothetical protein
MNIQTQKSILIQQINQINDINLIESAKDFLKFLLAKQKTEDGIISEEHQKLVCKRIKDAKPEDYSPWNKAKVLIQKSK